jgi:hypothetical protein
VGRVPRISPQYLRDRDALGIRAATDVSRAAFSEPLLKGLAECGWSFTRDVRNRVQAAAHQYVASPYIAMRKVRMVRMSACA